MRKAYAEAQFDFEEVKKTAREEIENDNGELLGEWMKRTLEAGTTGTATEEEAN